MNLQYFIFVDYVMLLVYFHFFHFAIEVLSHDPFIAFASEFLLFTIPLSRARLFQTWLASFYLP